MFAVWLFLSLFYCEAFYLSRLSTFTHTLCVIFECKHRTLLRNEEMIIKSDFINIYNGHMLFISRDFLAKKRETPWRKSDIGWELGGLFRRQLKNENDKIFRKMSSFCCKFLFHLILALTRNWTLVIVNKNQSVELEKNIKMRIFVFDYRNLNFIRNKSHI